MRWQCALLVGLLGIAAGAPLRADPAASRAVIHDCRERAKPDSQGLQALRADCPGLETALADLTVNALLPRDWQDRISPQKLSDLEALADRYAQTAPSALPNPSRLQTIARQLPAPLSSLSAWERFKHWLASWVFSNDAPWPGWLRWLTDWRPGGRFLIYGLVGLVLIAAAVVIGIELRAAGVFGPERRGARRPQRSSGSSSRAAEVSVALDIDRAPAHLRPVLLLRSLVAALTQSQRLAHDRDLTCRELISAARFDTLRQREIFASVALLAEQVLYGAPDRLPPHNDELLSSARGLERQLAAPAEQPVP